MPSCAARASSRSGPRTEGAPLNAEDDEEADAIMSGIAVEPERPAEEVTRRV